MGRLKSISALAAATPSRRAAEQDDIGIDEGVLREAEGFGGADARDSRRAG